MRAEGPSRRVIISGTSYESARNFSSELQSERGRCGKRILNDEMMISSHSTAEARIIRCGTCHFVQLCDCHTVHFYPLRQ